MFASRWFELWYDGAEMFRPLSKLSFLAALTLALGGCHSRESVQAERARRLVDTFHSADSHPARTVKELAAIGAPAVEPLVSVLTGEDFGPHAEQLAQAALIKIGRPAVGPLLDVLRRRSRIGKPAAIRALAEIRATEAVRTLLDVLGQDDAGLSSLAAEALGEIGDRRAVPQLAGALRSSRPDLARAAARALAKLGQDGVPTLIGALRSGSSVGERAAAAEALGGIQSEQALEALLDAVSRGAVEVRESAVIGLSASKDPRAMQAIIGRAFDPSAEVRLVSLECLPPLGNVGVFIQKLRDEDPIVRGLSVQCLTRLHDRSVAPALVKMLGDRSSRIRAEAATGLGELRYRPAVGALCRGLSDARAPVRAACAGALGRIGDQAAVSKLLAVLSAGLPDAKDAAITALGNLRSPKAVAPLVGLLNSERGRLRWSAVDALGRIGPPAVPALLRAADVQVGNALLCTVRALGRTHDRRALPKLLGFARNPDRIIRYEAIRALGELRDDRAVPELSRSLRETDRGIVFAAIDALGDIGSASAVVSLVGLIGNADLPGPVGIARRYRVRVDEYIGETLGRIPDPRCVAPLLRLVRHSDWRVRADAAASLGAFRGPDVVKRLCDALSDDSPGVVEHAVASLRRIGDRSAAPALVKLVESGSIVRGPAIVALGDLGDAGAIPTIQDSLSDYMPSVRAAARDALAKLAHTGR